MARGFLLKVRRINKILRGNIKNPSTKKLLFIIDEYINQKLNYNDFYSKFNDLVREAHDIDDDEAHFEWEINDRLAFAGDDPIDAESRKYGYIGAQEFRDWLVNYKQKNIHFWG